MGSGAGRETHLPRPSGTCVPRPECRQEVEGSFRPRHVAHAALRSVLGIPRPKDWAAPLGSRGHPAGLGPAGQSRKAAPGHRKRRIQPASPRHARGTTLRGSGRGRRAGGMRRGHVLAWGKRDGEGSGNHRTCPSPELGPRGLTYPCSHRPFTPAGDRTPGTTALRPPARYTGLAGASWPLAADELIFHPLE